MAQYSKASTSTALFLLCLLGFCSAQWTKVQPLEEAAYSGQAVKDCHLAQRADGGVHAIYKPTAVGGEWQLRYRLHNGSALGTSSLVWSLGFLGGSASIVESVGSGQVHVAWENWATGNETVQAAHSSDGGASWSTPAVVADYGTGDAEAKTPVLTPAVASSDGVLAHTWRATANSLWYNMYDPAAARYTRNTQVPGIPADNQYAVGAAAWWVDPETQSASVFRLYSHQDKRSSQWEVYFVSATLPAGGSPLQWSPEVLVSATANGSFVARPAAAASAEAGLLQIVWEDGDARLLYRLYNLTAWAAGECSAQLDACFTSPPLQFERGNYASLTAIEGPARAAGAGDFYVVYADSSNKVVYGKPFFAANATWLPAEQVSQGLGPAYTLATGLAQSGGGGPPFLVACWEYWGSGNAQQYVGVRPLVGSGM